MLVVVAYSCRGSELKAAGGRAGQLACVLLLFSLLEDPMSIRRLGVLTGGGDAPGLNPALKAIVYKASGHGIEVIGLYDGWRGLLNEGCGETLRLEDYMVRRWDRDGGTNLGSSRTNPFRTHLPGDREPKDRSAEVLANMERLHFDAVIALGGEDTLGVAHR